MSALSSFESLPVPSLPPRVLRLPLPAPAPLPLPAPRVVADPARLAAVITATTLAVTLAYALVRYVLLGSVAGANVPAYVLNKALAFTGLALLAATLVVRRDHAVAALRKPLAQHGFALSAMHVLLSLWLAGPAYYGKLYAASGRMTVSGEIALLLGAIALGALMRRSRQWLAVTALVAGGAHVAALGWPTWRSTSGWPCGLPPITLASVAVVAVALLLLATRPSRRRANRTAA